MPKISAGILNNRTIVGSDADLAGNVRCVQGQENILYRVRGANVLQLSMYYYLFIYILPLLYLIFLQIVRKKSCTRFRIQICRLIYFQRCQVYIITYFWVKI